MYEPGTVRLSNHTNADHAFWGFCLQVFHEAGPQQQVDCLALMGNKCQMSFLRTQRRIVCSRIERGTSNLSITSPTLNQLGF